jgi:N,N'-diacetyllegionaminate synthase
MTQIIAEIGLNHHGSEERALQMLEELTNTNIDAVTYQIREPQFYTSEEPPRNKLSDAFYKKAVKITHNKGLKFGIAICDESMIPFFMSIDIDFWKTLSWNFSNHPFNALLQETKKTVYMSTGLSGLKDIVEISSKLNNIILIHTQLSQKVEDVNLKAINTIRDNTKLPIAFGLHCNNQEVLKLAIAYEPESVFFYVKTNEKIDGLIDDDHAIFIDKVGTLANTLKILGTAVGTGNKTEKKTPDWVVY